jgi:hypothetical protein
LSAFSDRYASCPYIADGMLSTTGALSFAVTSLGSGTVNLDSLAFAP